MDSGHKELLYIQRAKNELDLAKIKTNYRCGSHHQSTLSNPPSSTTNNLPLNSLTSAKSDDNAVTNFSTVGGWITKTIIPENSFGWNIDLLRKSESRETNTNDFSFASEANLPLAMPLAAYSAENPLDLRNPLISILIFSSSRNFGEFDIMFSSYELGSVFQSLPDHIFGQAGVAFKYASDTFSSSNQFDNITNQDSGAFECGLSMADFAVRNDVLVNFNSHETNNDPELYKTFALKTTKKVKP